MVKVIRKPLIDINGRDFSTGEINQKALQEENKNFQAMIQERKKIAQDRVAKNRTGNSIYVQGFGLCII